MKRTVSVVGGGSSVLLFAAFIDSSKYDVTIYEKRSDIARKFLVAGDGGFNLTHAESIEKMIERYTPNWFLKNALLNFTNVDLQKWLATININTFEGSSHRIFPVKGIKPIEVLNAIKKVLVQNKIKIKNEHTWLGFSDNGSLKFESSEGMVDVQSDIVIFSLGGASWTKTGSDGKWLSFFSEKGIHTSAFKASNCAYKVKWSSDFIDKHESEPLKNIEIFCSGHSKKGELVITQFGIEGGAIYALSPYIRAELNTQNKASVLIDLKPTLSLADIAERLKNKGNKSISKILKDQLNLSSLQIDLLKSMLPKDDFMNIQKLAECIKRFPLFIIEEAPIDEAISTVGGIVLDEVNENFESKKMPNHYFIGEMLDWDAPTGGYLLQACFSMGVYVAKMLNKV